MTSHAFAKCTSKTKDGPDYYIVKVNGFNPPPFNPGDIQIGGVIYEGTATSLVFSNAIYPYSPTVSCPEGALTYVTGVGAVGANNIYPTNIPNIGIRIVNPQGQMAPFMDSCCTWFENKWNIYYAPRIQLIKTGNVTEAGVLSGPYARYTANSPAGQTLVEYHFSRPVLVTPKVPTCAVTTPRIQVPMEKTMATTAFAGVGSTAPPKPFEIGLACSGGDTGTATNVYVTLTDATTPGNRSTTLSLSNDSMASGVGIQILKDNLVLGYGPDSSSFDNPNRWWAGRVAQGATGLVIPLQARYVQTHQRIVPGSAKAYATFTMSYQ
ncbi:fimbria adhesin protein [Burkholderia lata]|uniref:fimbrial protein n=1 Tax=Burkholderia lata (strain ATCC 17760 / DSM 23089 / LMG 22485 / NCIMB 9086 / R18194 / 383) TaxID=482957 RepID=UPI0014534553|nr:fimbrial protein [Burkholderia lata]VWC77330.1 fimbria adhesin protein [Burkholderia lata]